MMDEPAATGPLVLGATGRVGLALAHLYNQGHWTPDQTPIWQYRHGSPPVAGRSLLFDPLNGRLPDNVVPTAIIMLSGVTAGTPEALAVNTDLAQAASELGQQRTIPTLIASSQAVYGAKRGSCREGPDCHPTTPYGIAKYRMEQAVMERPGVTCLRIGNIAGVTQPFTAMAKGHVEMDIFPDGYGPKRAFIGLLALAQSLMKLCKTSDLPPVLNLAQPGRCDMADLVDAAGIAMTRKPADTAALDDLDLDLTLMARFLTLAQATPQGLVRAARQAGWGHG